MNIKYELERRRKLFKFLTLACIILAFYAVASSLGDYLFYLIAKEKEHFAFPIVRAIIFVVTSIGVVLFIRIKDIRIILNY